MALPFGEGAFDAVLGCITPRTYHAYKEVKRAGFDRFVAALHRAFDGRRRELLGRRADEQFASQQRATAGQPAIGDEQGAGAAPARSAVDPISIWNWVKSHDRSGEIFVITGMGYYPNLGTKDAYLTEGGVFQSWDAAGQVWEIQGDVIEAESQAVGDPGMQPAEPGRTEPAGGVVGAQGQGSRQPATAGDHDRRHAHG